MSPPQTADDAPAQGAVHENLSSPTPPAVYRNFDATATDPVDIHELDRRRRAHNELQALIGPRRLGYRRSA